MTPPVFGITGWKNAGKTTLTERLVAEFTRRGLRVSTVKHAHHGFDIDREGTDSHRHRIAGAAEVALVTGARWALMHEVREAPEPTLDEVLARLGPCDLVLVEGFKREPQPKIECRRSETRDRAPIAPNDASVVAVAADHPVTDPGVRSFGLDDIAAIADFIAATLRLPAGP